MKAVATDRVLREPEVCQMVGLGRVSIWRLARAGKFPQRIQLSERTVGWRLSDIQKWISERKTVAA